MRYHHTCSLYQINIAYIYIADNINCLACKPGYYGPMCSNRCGTNCKNDTCDSVTGTCEECKPGYHLKNGLCNPCPYKCKTCSNDTYCRDCVDGFFVGSRRDGQCIKCPVNCKTCKNGTRCTRCKKGWDGEQCQSRCPGQCFDGSCSGRGYCWVKFNYKKYQTEDRSECIAGRNRCNASMVNCKFCHDDYDDPCRECQNGWYGQFCSTICSDNCDMALGCHKKNGSCYRIDHHRSDLFLNATVTCDTSMVNCKLCQSGQTGCYECKTGWFGNNCSDKCPSLCDMNLGCTKKFGSCLRIDGKSKNIYYSKYIKCKYQINKIPF